MRLYEFDDSSQVALVLKNIIGRAGSRGQPANINWEYLNQVLARQGIKLDQETFKGIYDASPMIQNMVHNFTPRGIELKVPGTSRDREEPGSDIDKSKDSVNQTAAANAYNQLTAK